MSSKAYTNLLVALQTFSVVDVTFEKCNGEIRSMRCTLKKERIPKEKHPKSKKKRSKNPLVVTAYDLEADGWRSFRIQSVIEWEVSE